MKWRLYAFSIGALILLSGFGYASGRQVGVSDGTVSINADDITIGRLLQVLDEAVGMHSSVPPEIAGQKITLHLSGVSLTEAVHKIFEKLPVDYVFIKGRGVTVTGMSQEGLAEPAPVYEPPAAGVEGAKEEVPEAGVRTAERPAVTPTPFGPIIQQPGVPVVHLPPLPGEAPAPPFFAPDRFKPTPPAGAAGGPAENNLFAPISIYQNPGLPAPNPHP